MHNKSMAILHLVYIMCLTRHSWKAEIMYNRVYKILSPKFEYAVLNTCKVLWPDFQPQEIPGDNYHHTMVKFILYEYNIQKYDLYIINCDIILQNAHNNYTYIKFRE